jgi:response regulator NasT
MLKVLLVDDTPDRASELKRALSVMEGVAVACTVESAVELFDRVAEHKPDIVLIDTDSPSRDVLEQIATMSTTAPRPVVMFTATREDETIRAALKAGVSAYIVDGIAPAASTRSCAWRSSASRPTSSCAPSSRTPASASRTASSSTAPRAS